MNFWEFLSVGDNQCFILLLVFILGPITVNIYKNHKEK